MTPSRRPHPHFDDGGTLDWQVEWDAARALARAQGRLVFGEPAGLRDGREPRSQCRALVQGAVPHPEVAPLLQEHFVALASDCDDPEDEVLEVARELEDAQMLPFVMILDADGELRAGASGEIHPAELRALLSRALERASCPSDFTGPADPTGPTSPSEPPA